MSLLRPFLPLTAAAAMLAIALPAATVTAQGGGQKPVLSPRDTTRATVEGVNVLIDYSRPSKRGREIFGKLVPYDSVWRTGANAATTLVIDKPITLDNLRVPAGTYTIYTIPGTLAWTLIINKQTGQWGTKYDASQDLGRVTMTTRTLSSPVEQFEIAIRDGELHFIWDTTDAYVPITTGAPVRMAVPLRSAPRR